MLKQHERVIYIIKKIFIVLMKLIFGIHITNHSRTQKITLNFS
jgi:hypothetical protein